MHLLRSCFFLLVTAVSTFSAEQSARIFEAFEGDGYGQWHTKGKAFGLAPSHGGQGELANKITGYRGGSLASSFNGGSRATGALVSSPFEIKHDYLSFLLGGGDDAVKLGIKLIIGGEAIVSATGKNSNKLEQVVWDVRKYKGKKASLLLADWSEDDWGYLLVDHIAFTNQLAATQPSGKKDPVNESPEDTEFISSKAIPGLLIPPGTSSQVYADHDRHQVYSPTALCFDEKGRMLISETHRFRYGVEDNRGALYWLLDDLASQKVEDRRAMHEKWQHKKPLDHYTAKSEKIRFLEDSDGDGIADRSEVYAEGFNDLLDGTAAGIFHLNGTSYFACIPKIWKLRDQNDDGIAEEREVVQDGFGVRVSFSGHDLNGFALGPDGRIYGTVGDRGFNVTTKDGQEFPYPDQGCIFRFEPDGSNFEVLHTGLRNPKEIAFDKWGNGITVDNNSDQGDKARIVYLVEGGDSGWRMGHQTLSTFHSTIGIPNIPLNPWMTEKMWEPRHDGQPAWFLPPIANLTSGPSGLAYHPGAGFSTRCKDRFLICDYRGNIASSGIWSFMLKPHGAGLKLYEFEKFNWNVAATDVEFGYDGKLYVTDFIGGWKSHAAGQIYSLADESSHNSPLQSNALALLKSGFTTKSGKQLARLMDHPDLRIRTRAHLALAEKDDAFPILENVITSSSSPLHRLHATWGLWKMARSRKSQEATNLLTLLLKDADPEIRAQAARALGEAPLSGTQDLKDALLDQSPRVQSFAALSLARLQDKSAWPGILGLLEKNNDQDVTLRHAGIMALIGCGDANKISQLKNRNEPQLRLAAVIALRTLKHPGLLEFLADPDPRIADEAIRAVHDLPVEEGRPNLARMLDQYSTGTSDRELSRMQMRRLIHSAFRFGTPESARRLLTVAQNSSLHLEERLEALRLVNLWPEPPVVDQSTGLFSPLAPRDSADVLPVLRAEFPALLKLRGSLLRNVLTIAKTYELSEEIISTNYLAGIIEDSSRDLIVRQNALMIFVNRSPENLIGKLKKMSLRTEDPLYVDALAELSKISPTDSLAAVEHAILNGDLNAQRKGWNILGTWKGEKATPIFIAGLKRLKNNQVRQDVQLELLEAVEKRKEQEVVSALASYQDSLKSSGPLAEWKMTFYGGDPKKGARLFKSHPAAQCSRCHGAQPGHTGSGEAGPNLHGIGEVTSSRSLVESLVDPSAKIASGYGIASITLSNGESLAGNIMRESEDSLDLLTGMDLWRIKKSDITLRGQAMSSMPPMGLMLSKREIRDLVAWLSNRRGERISRSLPEPKPYFVEKNTVVLETKAEEPKQPDKITNEGKEVEEAPIIAEKPTPSIETLPKETGKQEAPPATITELTESKTAEKAVTPSEPTTTNNALYIIPGEIREDAGSGSKSFWIIAVFFWIVVCLLPVITGLRNR